MKSIDIFKRVAGIYDIEVKDYIQDIPFYLD